MKKYFAILYIGLILSGCSRKAVPVATDAVATESSARAAPPKPTTVVPKVKTPAPKTIIVSDAAAKKTVDGRYYYDFNGKRYWKNFKDGKFYMFNKAMFNNDDFKPAQ